ncbi:MAG TPA: membrane dipeptidase [Candidatus Dormibacteraeota bacterium]
MTAPIVDAHLDLASNVLGGRDYTLEVAEIRAAEQRTDHQCTVSLPALRKAGVAVAFATLFVGPSSWADDGEPVYETPPWDRARAQLAIYRGWERDGRVRVITSRRTLDAHLDQWARDSVMGLVILIESADSIERPSDLGEWFAAGVRLIGPAWSRTRYAGGTRRPGGLTELGRDLVGRMADIGIPLDASHLAEEAFWQALEIGNHALCASHSNARAIVDTDRQLTDEMISAIGRADGVIGLNLYNHFLHPAWADDDRGTEVTLADVRRHADHIAGLIGWHSVGIGSDLDGGLGLEETPVEIETVADLVKLGEVAPAQMAEGVLGANWLRWLRQSLPAT